ncbi:Uncharacterised protein [Bordetella ansorpii]|uniref:Uncharacterized protein n=1 Tax=Bordetella ansorpii TaxID=288768 RepID=A0A157Q0S6_9BORD|nr:Uncharacterised protein [Bordetella ansorpii]
MVCKISAPTAQRRQNLRRNLIYRLPTLSQRIVLTNAFTAQLDAMHLNSAPNSNYQPGPYDRMGQQNTIYF